MAIPQFIRELRARIGKAPLLLTAATGVVLRENADTTQVLLVQLADGRWSPPAGIIEPGEQPHDAAVREVLEESGVICAVEDLVWAYAGKSVTFSNGDQASHIELVFRCRFVGGDPVPDGDETFGAAWWDVQALPCMSEDHTARVYAGVAYSSRTKFGREG